MSMTKCPEWIESIRSNAGLIRGLIVHGEVFDIRRNPSTLEYQRISNLVASLLEDGSFEKVIVWDPINSIRVSDQSIWDKLSSNFSPSSSSNLYPSAPGNEFGEVITKENISLEHFLSVVHSVLSNSSEENVAFVMDYANLALPSGQNMQVDDKRLVSRLVAALTESKDAHKNNRNNIIVLISPTDTALPRISLPGSAFLKDISIPMPSQNERLEFLSDHFYEWQIIDRPKPGQKSYDDLIDLLDGMSLKDMLNIGELSKRTAKTKPLSIERLISLYKHGIQTSPWENLSREKLLGLTDKLSIRVKGQDHAIKKVKQIVIRAHSGLAGLQHSKSRQMPKGTLFFVGPTGVGKTELAKGLAEFLFGDEEAFIRFDMSEFNHEHSDQRLIGAPPGYVGYEEGGQLTNAIRKRPFCVLLFDEIEKAHVRILDKFLQILEDGRLTDGRGQTVSFSDSVIIFTSNICEAHVDPNLSDSEAQSAFLERVKDHFVKQMGRPELLNRIGDNIVAFNFVRSLDFLAQIIKGKLHFLEAQLMDKYGIKSLRFVDETRCMEAISSRVEQGMGGRGALTALTSNLLDPLSLFLFEEVPDNSVCFGKSLEVKLADSGSPELFEFKLLSE